MHFIQQRTFVSKLLILITLMFSCLFIGSVIGFALIRPIFNVNIFTDLGVLSPENGHEITGPILKFIQLIQVTFFFIIPANIFAKWMSGNPTDYLGFHRSNPGYLVFAALIMICVLPFIAYTQLLNQEMVLPSFLSGIESWMKTQEASAEKVTEIFLNVSTVSGLLINLVVIALLAAIGEELIFRGILQRLFMEKLNNPHLAIWITAIIFSAIHLQFYGFLPRMLLGVLLGYLYFWSGSLTVPIFAHFLYNGIVVTADYLYRNKHISIDLNEEQNLNVWLILSSLLISFALIYFRKLLIWKKTG